MLAPNTDVDFRHGGGNTPLHSAARYGWSDIAAALLERGADIDARNDGGSTPLHRAAYYNRTDTAAVLLDHGAEVEVHNDDGYTPLGYAFRNESWTTAQFLMLAPNTDVDFRHGGGNTPLHYAARYGWSDIAAALLERGADIDARNDGGNTPLHRAAYYGRTDTAAVLLDHGAEVEVHDDDGYTPLNDAFRNDKWTTAQFLMLAPNIDVDFRHDDGRTPLHYAARYGWPDTAAVLLERGADIDARDDYGNTPLHRAAYYGRTDTAVMLLDHGAVVEVHDDDGYTPLNDAFRNDKWTTAQFLMLAPNTNVDFPHDDGNTLLHYAARYGWPDIAAVLLERGADIDARDDYGNTPEDRYDGDLASGCSNFDIDARDGRGRSQLHAQSEDGNWVAVSCLLTLGANVNIQDDRGQTPLHLAVYTDHSHTTRILVWGGADGNIRRDNGRSPLDIAFAQDDAATVRMLFSDPNINFDVNALDNQGRTLLHLAAMHGFTGAAALLMDRGIDVNARDDKDRTPLHYAAHGNHLTTALLLSRGADVAVQDERGKTPLDLALAGTKTGLAELLLQTWINSDARPLVTNPAVGSLVTEDEDATGLETACATIDIHARDGDGRTQLHHAAADAAHVTANCLLDRGADVNARDDYGNTALHIAARTDNVETATLLLNRGADPNLPDNNGRTPLAVAVAKGNMTVVDLLRHAESTGPGAVPSPAREADDESPSGIPDAATDARCVEPLARIVQSREADGLAPLHHAAQNGDLPLAQCLLWVGAAVDVRQPTDDATPLHLAAYFGHDGLVELLLAAGADVHAQIKPQNTPLHLAAERSHADAVARLLAAGADPDARNVNGDTPLHLVARRGGDWDLWHGEDWWAGAEALTVHQLLAAGADPILRNEQGQTAPDVAAGAQHYCLALSLLEDPNDLRRYFRAWLAEETTGDLEAVIKLALLGGHVGAHGALHGALHMAPHMGVTTVMGVGVGALKTASLIVGLSVVAVHEIHLFLEGWEQWHTLVAWANHCTTTVELWQSRHASDAGYATLRVGEGLSGSLDRSGGGDVYAVALVAGTTYRIDVAPGTLGDPELALFAPDGDEAAARDDSSVGVGSRIDHTAAQSGTYLVRVSAANHSDTGTYELSVRPLDTDRDAEAVPHPPRTVRVGQTLSGSLDGGGEHDLFEVELQGGTRYRIEVSLETLPDSELTLYRSGRAVAHNNDVDGANRGSRIDYTAVTTDIFLLRVEGHGDGDTGSYRLSVALAPNQPQPSLDDHGDGFVNATPIRVGPNTDGHIERARDRDMFRVQLTAGRRYLIGTGIDSLRDTEIWLYNPRQGLETHNDDGPSGHGGSRIVWNAATTGEYFVAVEGKDDQTGTYTLTVFAMSD